MSHIIKSDDDIKKMSEQLEILRRKGYTNDVLGEILTELIPNNENYQVKGIIENTDKPALFNPYYRKINISPDCLHDYILKLNNSILKMYPNIEKEELFRNFVIFVLVHEVEHVYQHLIGNELIDNPYKLVIDAYKNLSTLKISKKTNPIYTQIMIRHFFSERIRNKPTFLLERNANVEAYDLLCKVANYENNLEIKKFFEDQISYQLTLGYNGFSNGSVEETYLELWASSIYDTFSKNENIPIEDRVRYGLPIDKETRKKVLRKEFKI